MSGVKKNYTFGTESDTHWRLSPSGHCVFLLSCCSQRIKWVIRFHASILCTIATESEQSYSNPNILDSGSQQWFCFEDLCMTLLKVLHAKSLPPFQKIKNTIWILPSGPVVKTLNFHCRDHEFDPCSGIKLKSSVPPGMAKIFKKVQLIYVAWPSASIEIGPMVEYSGHTFCLMMVKKKMNNFIKLLKFSPVGLWHSNLFWMWPTLLRHSWAFLMDMNVH